MYMQTTFIIFWYLYFVKYFAQKKTLEQYPSLFLDTLETETEAPEQL